MIQKAVTIPLTYQINNTEYSKAAAIGAAAFFKRQGDENEKEDNIRGDAGFPADRLQ